jgi:hypothetical protein
MATTEYQEGMAVYIKGGVPVDAWGREVEGYEIPSESAPEPEPVEDDRYDEMSAQELKDELQRRREAGREIDTTGVTRKAQLAQALREDDKR